MSNTSAKKVSSRKILQLVLTFLIVGISVCAAISLYFIKAKTTNTLTSAESQLFKENSIFIDVPEKELNELRLKPKEEPYIVRQRYVRINHDRLNNLVEQLKIDPSARPKLYLDLFPDTNIVVTLTSRTDGMYGYSVTGEVEGESYTHFVLGSAPSIQLQLFSGQYAVERAGWDIYTVQEIDQSKIEDSPDDVATQREKR